MYELAQNKPFYYNDITKTIKSQGEIKKGDGKFEK